MEKIAIKNSLNQNIAAVVHYPQNQTDKLAILCPGYLDSKDYLHLVELANRLAEKGFTAVRFDPIGTWDSEGAIEDYVIENQLKDIHAILDFMLSGAAYKYILVGGHSRGGLVSLLYAAQDPRISAVLGIMPPHSLIRTVNADKYEKWKQDNLRVSHRDKPDKSGDIEISVPYSNFIADNKFNLLEEIKKVQVPITLVAGELDATCLPEEVRKIYDSANEPKKFINLKGIGHGYRRNLAEVELVNNEILKALEL